MYSYTKVYSVTMTSGSTLSAELDLGCCYERMFLQVPTMASGSLYIKVSDQSGGSFYRLAISNTDFSVNSAATQRVHQIPAAGFRYMKIENSSGVTDTVMTFKVIGAN